MKSIKCYGQKNVIVPKEKSFIRKFFDGNESSGIFTNDSSLDSEGKCHKTNVNEYEENKCHIFDSPNLFNEDLPLKQKKYGLRSVADPKYKNERRYYNENKENIECNFNSPDLFKDEFSFEQENNNDLCKVGKPKRVVKNRKHKYAKKQVKGIQHLSTKYCKALQPCWEEFEKYDLNIERPKKENNPNIIKQQVLKDTKQYVHYLPCTSTAKNEKGSKETNLLSEICISPKRIKTSAFYFPSDKTLESSGELFTKTPNYKKSLTNKNSVKKKKSFHKKHSNKFSHKVMTEIENKINQCMQNVDLSQTCSKSIYSNVSNYKISAYPHDSALQKTIPIQNTRAIPSVEAISINKDFSDTTIKTSKNQELSAADTLALSAKNKFSVSPRCNNKVTNSENSQHNHEKLGHLFKSCLEIHEDSNNDSHLTSNSPNLCKDGNLIQNISNSETLYQDHKMTKSDKLQTIVHEAASMKNSQNSIVSCKSTSDKISDQPIYINQDESNHIQSKLVLSIKTKACNLSHELQPFGKDSDTYINNNNHFIHPEETNISCIVQTYNKSYGVKQKGNFVTSTPVTRKSKFHHNVNAEMITLNNDENVLESKAFSKEYASFYERVKENKHTKPVIIEKPTISFLNCSEELAAIEIPNPVQCSVPLNLHKSRTASALLSKSVTHSESLKKCQSLLNLSSINASSEREKTVDFTRAKLLKLCDQDSVTPFSDIYEWKKFKVVKIGEGTYGEVFMLSKGKVSSVLKVIAVSEDPNVKNLQGLSSVYSEIKISKSLSELRNNKKNLSKNFVKVKRSSVVSGSYPAILMRAWDDFSKDRSTYNDRPDIYHEDQLFVILELEYGGIDMSCFALRNAVEAEIILKQVAVSLAVAEEEFSFEHRDLHLGNILVKRSRSKTMSYKIRGKDISFPCLGLQVTIIDFTLSLLLDKGYIYYYDLAEDSLFDQTGDYQFDVYKSMRRHLDVDNDMEICEKISNDDIIKSMINDQTFIDSIKTLKAFIQMEFFSEKHLKCLLQIDKHAEKMNKWEECSLYSNVLWLKYLCKKLKESKYTHPTAVTHKRALKAIDSFNTQLMKCSCALESLEKCGITKTVFQRSMSNTSKRSVLVSRNSKSKLSICN